MRIYSEHAEILLMEYAAGSLDEAASLLAACYVTLCPQARSYMRDCESLGGALIETYCDPVAMNRDSIKHVLNRIDAIAEDMQDSAAQAESPSSARTARGAAAETELPGFCRDMPFPEPLIDHIRRCGRPARWRKLYPGLQYYPLPAGNGDTRAMLVNMAPGARALRHSHPGAEYTLILRGAYYDEYGSYRAGDLVIVDETVGNHRPVASDEGCLCLSVTQAPVRFAGPLGALLHMILRT